LTTLEGKAAFVTGASRGIGKAIALGLGRAGVAVAVAARSETETPDAPGTIHQTVAELEALGARGLALRCDITDPAQVASAVERAVAAFGHLDLLVNNAGVLPPRRPFLDIPLERWEESWRLIFLGQVIVTRAVLPHLLERGQGLIVNISSPAARTTAYSALDYGVAKAAIDRLTFGLAEEYGPRGIRVVSLHPAFTATERMRARGIDLERARPPEEVAEAVVLLAERPELAERYHGQAVSPEELRAQARTL
jgi:citronellol/citronellal dehydrogenase